MGVALDTLAQAKRLREAGFNEEQAEALAAGLRDAAAPFDTSVFATKAEIDALKANVATKAELAALKADVATQVDLAAGLAALKADFLQWIAGLVIIGAFVLNAIVVIGGMFGLAKLLGH